MARPDLIILDCDGVLVDSERIAVRVTAELLGQLGWRLDPDEIVERFVGRSQRHMEREIDARVGLPEGWVGEFEQRQREALEAELTVVDGVVEALDAVEAATCVASSGSRTKLRLTLGLTGLYDRFEGRIFSVDEVARGKPAPHLFLHAAKLMGAAPESCIVVEDSRHGVEAGLRAGMAVLGYAGGVTPAERLRADGVVVFDDMRALPGLIGATR